MILNDDRGDSVQDEPKQEQITPAPQVATVAPHKDAKGVSITGMVLGICSIVLGIWLGFVLGVMAIIFSAVGLKRKKNGMAIAGLVTGIIGTLIGIAIGFFVGIAAYVGVQERAEESSIMASASNVLKQAELFNNDNGAYPSFEEMESTLNAKNIDVDIEMQGSNSGADVIYIPCYGYGAIVWYWSSTYEDYESLYAGSTDECEWN